MASTRLKPGTRNSIYVSHVGGKNPAIRVITSASKSPLAMSYSQEPGQLWNLVTPRWELGDITGLNHQAEFLHYFQFLTVTSKFAVFIHKSCTCLFIDLF